MEKGKIEKYGNGGKDGKTKEKDKERYKRKTWKGRERWRKVEGKD